MARKPRVFVAGGEVIFCDPNEVVEFVELIGKIKKRKVLKPGTNPVKFKN
jgi:hypothetical protein